MTPPGETPLARTRRARRIVRTLQATYPDAHCELEHRSPFELLVATVLSAQSTDRRVNGVTPQLFAAYPDAFALSVADPMTVQSMIRPVGFFQVKAATIIALSGLLVQRFDGAVPPRLEDLVALPGVGRKTANVVLTEAFGAPAFTVDTHVLRLSRRLGLTTSTDPLTVERDLDDLIPRRDRGVASQVLIWHGRRCCHARVPACGACPIARWCPSFGAGPTDPAAAAPLVRDQGRA